MVSTRRNNEQREGTDVKKLDDEQIGELREIFRSFDRNKDGSLTQLELGSLLRSLGLKPSEDQLERMIQKADTNNNGLIEFSESVALMEPDLVQSKCPYTKEQLRQMFTLFDRDENGFIMAAELAHSMAKLGHALTITTDLGLFPCSTSSPGGSSSRSSLSRRSSVFQSYAGIPRFGTFRFRSIRRSEPRRHFSPRAAVSSVWISCLHQVDL
ncbi:Probable calcium-binding protein CML17 [Linum perenne]